MSVTIDQSAKIMDKNEVMVLKLKTTFPITKFKQLEGIMLPNKGRQKDSLHTDIIRKRL